jgi:hypothetical protein
MPAVFGPSQDGEYENTEVFPVAGLICREGRFFLATFSLGQQRKSYSAAPADEDRRVFEAIKVAGSPPSRG